jgi:hypothetical protein
MDLVKVNFIDELTSLLKEKKKLSESSIKTYLRNLIKLNKDETFKNFNFLKDVVVIQRRLESYKENTKRNYLISVVSCLSVYDKPAIKKLHDKYYNLMMAKNDQIKKEVKPSDLTVTQEKNWMSWDDILKKYKELEEIVDTFVTKKGITDEQYNVLLSYVILSLYIHQSPRRNKDYQIMRVTNNYTNELSKEFNYLDLSKKDFVFNSYKTSSKYGTQRIPINDELWKVLLKYFRHHKLISFKNANKKPVLNENQEGDWFLIGRNNNPLDKVNSITRILNKVFDKAIGSSMLRHIYLTNKWGDVVDEQKKDASDMAHSEAQQKDYIKKPKEIVVDF